MRESMQQRVKGRRACLPCPAGLKVAWWYRPEDTGGRKVSIQSVSVWGLQGRAGVAAAAAFAIGQLSRTEPQA